MGTFFPIELKILSRAERLRGQIDPKVTLVPLSDETIQSANSIEYERRVIDGGDLEAPARIMPAGKSLIEKIPANNNPGPYIIGIGDEFSFSQEIFRDYAVRNVFTRKISVQDDGYLSIFEIGRI